MEIIHRGKCTDQAAAPLSSDDRQWNRQLAISSRITGWIVVGFRANWVTSLHAVLCAAGYNLLVANARLGLKATFYGQFAGADGAINGRSGDHS